MDRTPSRRLVALRWAIIATVATALCGCNLMTGLWKNTSGARYFQEGNYSLARDEFRRAILQDPSNPDYWHNLATAMKKQGDLAGAERIYRKALLINPSHQPSYHSLAQLLLEEGRQAEAMDLMQTWAATQPYLAESHIELAWMQREMGDLASAEQSLLQALKIQPNHPIALAHLGQLYQDTGQTDRALAMYRRSLATNWFQPEVQSRVAALGYSPATLMAQAPRAGGASFRTAGPAFPTIPAGPPRAAWMPPRDGAPAAPLLAGPAPSFAPPASTQAAGPGIIPQTANADPAHAPPSDAFVPQTSNSLPEVSAF